MSLIVDLFRTMRDKYSLAVDNGEIHLQRKNKDYYGIVNRDLYEWFDKTRNEHLGLFEK